MQLIKSSSQRRIDHWVAFAFCSFLSLMALGGSVMEAFQGNSLGWWAPGFFSFLPMCFFYMGAVTARMQREINELQSQLELVEFQSVVNRRAPERRSPATGV
jgi:hypothetical protein